MALTYGYFNALNHDRLYDADQMSDMFEGILSPNGIYEAIGDAFLVTANNDMTVTVGTGRGFVERKWMKLDEPEILSLSSSHESLNRYTAIIFRLDKSTREITLEAIDGEGSTGNPVKPEIIRNDVIYDICLAYILVKKGVTAITQKSITDVRPDRAVCGWITGVVEQVDVSQLFIQYQNAYEEMMRNMEQWQNRTMIAYDEWFQTLTQDLEINMYVACYEKHVTGLPAQIKNQRLDMTGYVYDSSDIIFVFVNGLELSPTDYTLDVNTNPPTVKINLGNESEVENEVFIRVLQTKVGNPPSEPTIIQIPTVTIGTYVYDGNEHGPVITNLDSEHIDVDGDVTAIEPGNYTLTLSLKSPSTTIWSDYTTEIKTYYYTIQPQTDEIQLSIDEVFLNRIGGTEDVTVTYNGDGTLSATSNDTNVATVEEVN